MCNLAQYKVIKHNKIVQSKSAFSAMEHKIILMAMAQIRPKDKDFKMYKVPIQDVIGSTNTAQYKDVRKSVDKLHKSVIEMEDSKGWRTYSFITMAQGEHGKSYIEVQFHKDIQSFLLGLKSQYTSYTLSNVLNFKKNYSLRIYELCKQVQKIGKRELSIDYLKTLFSLEKKYRRYNNFKKDVIDSAVEEINQHSDLFLKYEEIKDGRKVDAIRFIIKQNKNVTDLAMLKTLDQIDLEQGHKERLLKTGFSCDEVKGLREKYTENRIASVLGSFEAYIDDIKHPKAWIEKTLQEYVDKADYKAVVERDLQAKREEAEKRRRITEKTLEIQNLEEKIAQDKQDIAEYQETGQLRPGDIAIRFKGKSVDEAIEELEDRVYDTEELLRRAERELSKLLK